MENIAGTVTIPLNTYNSLIEKVKELEEVKKMIGESGFIGINENNKIVLNLYSSKMAKVFYCVKNEEDKHLPPLKDCEIITL